MRQRYLFYYEVKYFYANFFTGLPMKKNINIYLAEKKLKEFI